MKKKKGGGSDVNYTLKEQSNIVHEKNCLVLLHYIIKVKSEIEG